MIQILKTNYSLVYLTIVILISLSFLQCNSGKETETSSNDKIYISEQKAVEKANSLIRDEGMVDLHKFAVDSTRFDKDKNRWVIRYDLKNPYLLVGGIIVYINASTGEHEILYPD